MEITATMVKDLREATGAGMMDCKKALVETGGDMDRSVDVLRTKGLADLAKKAGRATNEGLIAAYVEPSGKIASLVEVNCETDFVARNAEFTTFVSALAEQVAVDAPDGLTEGAAPLLTQAWKRNPSLTVEQALGEQVVKLGENMGIARFGRYEVAQDDAAIGSYVHGVGRIGVLVEVAGATLDTPEVATLARDLAMHAAAASPLYTTRDEVPADIVEHEKSIYMAQAAETGKPEAIQAKIAEGRLEKYFKEVCLVEQPFVKDPDKSVTQVVSAVAKAIGAELTVVRFTRWVLGETYDGPAPETCGC
jgi:elongation factor Ts